MSKKGRRHPGRVSITASEPGLPGDIEGRPDRWPALTGLRGIAALGVVLLHAYYIAGHPPALPAALDYLFSAGWSGVDIFFVLSAFLLSIPFVRRNENGGRVELGGYARHRLARILPAYYVQVAVLLAFGALGFGAPANGWSAEAVLSSIFFLYNFIPSLDVLVAPWWTLPVELSFYLVLPAFAALLRPGHWRWLLLGIVASLAYRTWLMHAGLTRGAEIAWVEHLPGRLHQFLIGMLAAYAFVRLQRRDALPAPALADRLAIGGGLVFIALPALGYLVTGQVFRGGPMLNPLLLYWHLWASLAIALVIVALAAGAPLAGRLLSSVPVQALGLISYSLYLWHYPVMLVLRAELGGQQIVMHDFWPFFCYSLVFSLLVASTSWWLVERPALRWSRRARPQRLSPVKLPA